MQIEVPFHGVDHLVFAVRSLEEAARRYRNLGFKVSPRGGHPALGSANHTIMFAAGDYLELLEAGEAGVFTSFYRDYAAAQEGLAGMALRAEDAHRTREALAAAGLRPENPLDFARPVELEGHTQEARFTVVQLPIGALPGGRIFFCQHHTPDLVWRPDLLDHPNSVLGLSSVTLITHEPESAAAEYRRLQPRETMREEGRLALKLGGTRLEFMTPASFVERYGEDPVADAPVPRFAAVRFCVGDLDRTAAVLTVHGVRFMENEGALEVFSSDAHGARLVFEPRPLVIASDRLPEESTAPAEAGA